MRDLQKEARRICIDQPELTDLQRALVARLIARQADNLHTSAGLISSSEHDPVGYRIAADMLHELQKKLRGQ